MTNLTVACVNVGDYLGRGDEYVDKLRSAVARHLHVPYRFECITESEQAGWWAKIELFKPGRFTGRVLYFDLDTVVVRTLSLLALEKGILDLRLWGWKTPTYGSGVMAWDAGEHEEIWTKFTPEVPKVFRGDQDWMTHLGGWQGLPEGVCESYRYTSRQSPPLDASVICFHGKPKPHEVTTGWVPQHWR